MKNNKQIEEQLANLKIKLDLLNNIRNDLIDKHSLNHGVDSFFGHVASAFDITGIILFGDSSPFVYGHDNNINIYKSLPCSPCFELLGGSSCPYNIACMKEISIEMVSNEIREILLKYSK